MKSYRLYRIFNSVSTRKAWSDIQVGSVFAVPTTIILIIWHSLSKPAAAIMKVWTCLSSNAGVQSAAVGTLIGYNAFIVLVNLWMAFKTRNVHSKFNETKVLVCPSNQRYAAPSASIRSDLYVL